MYKIGVLASEGLSVREGSGKGMILDNPVVEKLGGQALAFWALSAGLPGRSARR